MKWRFLVGVLIVSLLFAGCSPEQNEEPTPTPIPTSVVPDKPTYVVSRGLVENKQQFTARVSPIEEQGLFFKRGGYVKIVYVERGDWVEAGTVLAELEIEDLLNQLALAELDLEGVQKQFDIAQEAHQRQLFSAEMTLEIAKLRLEKAQLQASGSDSVAAAEARLERAKLQVPIVDHTSLKFAVQRALENLDAAQLAYKEALDRPWEPQRVRDSLLKNIANAERAYEEAQARYQVALAQAAQAEQLREYDLTQLEKDVEEARQAAAEAARVEEINLLLLQKEVDKAAQEIEWLQRGVDPSLSQRVESNQLKVQRLEDQVDTARLVAPFTGEITSLKVTPGGAVDAREKVAVIADPNAVDITADLTESQMGYLQEGQPAEVTMSSAPGQIFEAIIQTLPYPFGTGGGEIKVEDQDDRVHLNLLNPDEADLEAGDLVRVTVLIERSEDTLWLPPAAIRTFEGRRFVMVRVGDRLQKKDVKLGIEGEDRVEVLEGVEEGQIIEGL
jgi:multidrug efflux pump subunit AcrA (membrane-fusion protein)